MRRGSRAGPDRKPVDGPGPTARTFNRQRQGCPQLQPFGRHGGSAAKGVSMASEGPATPRRGSSAEGHTATGERDPGPSPRDRAVLMYSRGIYPAQLGGREVFVADLVRGLAARGRDVFLLTERDPGLGP